MSKLFRVVAVFGAALLTVGNATAEQPPTSGIESPTQATSTAASSVITWDGEQKVFRAPTDHEARHISEQLRTMLQSKSRFSSAQGYENERLDNGLVRLRLGVEALNLAIVTRRPDGRAVAACTQGPAHPAPADQIAVSDRPTAERPKSLPATEGWVEQ